MQAHPSLHLVSLFLEGSTCESETTTPRQLEASLRRLYDQGGQAHPGLTLSAERFIRFLREQLPPDTSAAQMDRLSAEGLFLACACLNARPRALARLQEAIATAAVVLTKLEPRAHVREEIRQAVFERMLVATHPGREKLREYRGAGSLDRWLKAVLAGTAISLRRKEGKVAGNATDDAPLAALASPWDDGDVALLKARCRKPFEAAFRAALAELTSKERNALRLHYVLGLTQEQLARVYSVHRVTAVRWLSSAKQRLQSATLARLRATLQLTRSEGAQVAALLRSGLEASLRSLLATSQ